MLEISVQTACWLNESDPDASFRFIKECGFEAVDYNIDNHLPADCIPKGELTTFFDQSVEELIAYYTPIKAAADKYGIRFAQMHGPFPMFVKDREDINNYLLMATEKTLEVAKFLGCPAVVVHPVLRSTKEKEIPCNLAIYRALMPAAKRTGVKICLENLYGGYKMHVLEGPCSDVEEACRYIDTLNAEAGEECFGFCFDLGHANLVGRNVRKYLNALGKRLTILHIHDNDGTTDSHMLPMTQTYKWGTRFYTDWDGFIEGLRDIGYTGALNFETFRVLQKFPQSVKPQALALIAALGKDFRDRILAPKEEK